MVLEHQEKHMRNYFKWFFLYNLSMTLITNHHTFMCQNIGTVPNEIQFLFYFYSF